MAFFLGGQINFRRLFPAAENYGIKPPKIADHRKLRYFWQFYPVGPLNFSGAAKNKAIFDR
jgi:hypothetical protein